MTQNKKELIIYDEYIFKYKIQINQTINNLTTFNPNDILLLYAYNLYFDKNKVFEYQYFCLFHHYAKKKSLPLYNYKKSNLKMTQRIFLIETHEVPKQESPIRMSDYSGGIFRTISSRKGMKKAICKGLVKLNGKIAKTGDILKGGETIELYQFNEQNQKAQIDVPIEVIFEDEYMAIVYKPAGMVVSGNKKWTLENALSNNLKKSNKEDALPRPDPIHRLDYPTSGLVMIGKTFDAVIRLNKLFENREVQKLYLAVTIDKMTESEGNIQFPIDGKKCHSSFKILDRVESPRFGYLNLVQLSPHTGRKHQLRIHMAHIGNPILGDLQHGIEGKILKGKGLYLHAFSLSFVHPYSLEKMNISIPAPKKFKKLFPSFNQ